MSNTAGKTESADAPSTAVAISVAAFARPLNQTSDTTNISINARIDEIAYLPWATAAAPAVRMKARKGRLTPRINSGHAAVA